MTAIANQYLADQSWIQIIRYSRKYVMLVAPDAVSLESNVDLDDALDV